jgi:hypothetical protein
MGAGARGSFKATRFSLPSGIQFAYTGSGAPTNGSSGTGVNVAGPGSFYIRTSNGAVYVNTNTKASPTWSQLGSVAALTSAHIFVGNGANVGTDVAMSGHATIDNTGAVTLAPTLLNYAAVAISAADIVATSAGKFGHAYGYPLVAAPAAGSALELVSATLIYDYAGAGYGAGGNISVNWESGGAAITGVVTAGNSLGAVADNVTVLRPLTTAGQALVVAAGINLVAAAAFTAGSATGVVRVKVVYRTHVTGLA